MATIEQGGALPDLELTGADGAPLKLRDFTGKPFVLYFYPKDDTTGCTREAQDFSALAADFAAAGVAVLGVSPDTAAKHAKFTAKYDLTVPLASDPDHVVMDAFGVWIEKNMYGRTYMGVERSTFLFGSDGTLAQIWRKVRVAGHAEQVLAAAKALG
jgi:peroxiredoxin Q/BCP